MAELVEYLPPLDAAGEPVSVAELKEHARWDADNTMLDDLIASTIIPGARQLAETRTGSAIRPGRYIQRLAEFPKCGGTFALTHGLAGAIESITYATDSGRQSLDLSAITSAVLERETLVEPVSGTWPDVKKGIRGVEITYTAGLSAADLTARYPSVRHWILMAASWALEQPELFVLAKARQGYQELPDDYLAGLLDPITLRTRF
jgi:uncharacterized phiE125 gp8 family phage protein